MLGIDAVHVDFKALKEAKERMGLTLTSTLEKQKDAVLQQLDTLKEKVQDIVERLGLQAADESSDIPATLAQALKACKEVDIEVEEMPSLPLQANAILEKLE